MVVEGRFVNPILVVYHVSPNCCKHAQSKHAFKWSSFIGWRKVRQDTPSSNDLNFPCWILAMELLLGSSWDRDEEEHLQVSHVSANSFRCQPAGASL